MAEGGAEKRDSRDSARENPLKNHSNSKSRSLSTSSRSSRSLSRSRSRERGSRSRRSRSRSGSTSRKPRHSSRRSHRSRSRSTSRDRSRRDRHRSIRRRDHRDRSRSRERHHSGSGRKRSRRDRSRSEERGRSRRDSDPRGGDAHGRRQRRRHDFDAAAAENATEKTGIVVVANMETKAESVVMEKKDAVEAHTDALKRVEGNAVEREDTPTSQNSVATSTATTSLSNSQSEEVDVSVTSTTSEQKNGEPEDKSSSTGSGAGMAPKVDVKSIKMDILKALADARKSMAGIKGATANGSAPTAAQPSAPVSSTLTAEPVSGPETAALESPTPVTALETTSEPSASAKDIHQAHSEADTKKATTPLKNQRVASADVDEFDMFSAAELYEAGLPLSPAGGAGAAVVGALQSNYDDADGYYKPSIGEVLHDKYRVLGVVGKGVFSTVLRCQRVGSVPALESEPDVVAIKLIRNNEIMREASQTEIKILTEISERDPRDKKYCVRLLDRFDHRNHVALVFEPMQMNVREAMKKFGGKGGISIQAVRIFCKHMLIALSHLDACGIVHADIKPDNILLDEKQTMVKLCDFGSAFESKEGKQDPTPYLVSRFYRAPEIVLGLPYDKAVDMWSVGCCLYEMFTGKVMFPGATNNEMLKLFMELKGKVPNKFIKKHRQTYVELLLMEPHFTEDNKFCSRELDRVTGKPVLRLIDAVKTRFDLGASLLSAKSSTDDRKQVLELRNLLDRMFTLDPAKRITPKEALAHPFVKTEGKQAAS